MHMARMRSLAVRINPAEVPFPIACLPCTRTVQLSLACTALAIVLPQTQHEETKKNLRR